MLFCSRRAIRFNILAEQTLLPCQNNPGHPFRAKQFSGSVVVAPEDWQQFQIAISHGSISLMAIWNRSCCDTWALISTTKEANALAMNNAKNTPFMIMGIRWGSTEIHEWICRCRDLLESHRSAIINTANGDSCSLEPGLVDTVCSELWSWWNSHPLSHSSRCSHTRTSLFKRDFWFRGPLAGSWSL